MASKGLKLTAIALILVVVAAGVGYWLFVMRAQQGGWKLISDGSLDLASQDGKIVGDLGQSYADLASFSYGYNGSLYFRFFMRGQIPNSIADPHVTSVWYQVLLDTDLNPTTGYRGMGNSDFTPDYVLQFLVTFDSSSKVAQAQSVLSKYSGSGTDWTWKQVGTGPVVISGGVGENFVLLRCEYQDLSVSKAATVQFLGRSGLMYDGQIYNDQVPDKGTVKITL